MACWCASLGWVSAGGAGRGITGEVGFEERKGGELGEGLRGEGERLGLRSKGRVGRHYCCIGGICKFCCEKLCNLIALKDAL